MDELAAFRAGEPEAVRALYRRHAGAVHTVARSLVGDPELAKEVVQQTFVKAWRAAATFGEGREVAPWLYAIARRTAIDVLRHERRPTIGGHAPEQDQAVTSISFERTWQVLEVRDAITALPEAERDVVRLQHLVGLSQAEVADRLGIPIGTVKSRSARAHQRLSEALGHLAPGTELADEPMGANQDPGRVRRER
jgi:RNA polymerase sigma-70 factor (ECF subfamily)